NIPGFTSLSGNEFAEKLTEQAIAQGVEFEFGTVRAVEKAQVKLTEEAAAEPEGKRSRFLVTTEEGGSFEGRSVILATGAKHRKLGLEKEEEFIGNGISFCAVCDGAFYKDQVVGVVGGGNSALVEAVLLADLVKKLYIFQDLPVLTAEAKLQESLLSHDNVEVLTNCRVTAYLGDEEFAGVTIRTSEGSTKDIPLNGLFVAIGLIPQNEAFAGLIDLDERGYAASGEDTKTKTGGVFVAGDCRQKRIRQVTTAASDGAVAALQAVDYLEGRA
ncbi:MAG: FAD-dependent oxidoreductase, partial [Lachnospiraceae bacterium]|nr:FAD-dependent oxidoreductase [Lachnospiraceae bacterium]